MAIIRKKQLKQMSSKEMNEKLSEIRIELLREKASSEIGTVKSPKKIRELRRSLAKILTKKNIAKKGESRQ